MPDLWTLIDDDLLAFLHKTPRGLQIYHWTGKPSGDPREKTIKAIVAERRFKYSNAQRWPCQGKTIVRYGRSGFEPGEYHPRIFRAREKGRMGYNMGDFFKSEKEAALQAARGLFRRLEEVFLYVEPSARNMKTYSHELRHLLVLACTEVESNLKAILRANDATGRFGKHLTIRDYHHLVRPMRLGDWHLVLESHPDVGTIHPFRSWTAATAPRWWSAYNKVKHDRENELHRATLRNVIDAMAGLYVSIAGQFGVWALHERDRSVSTTLVTPWGGIPDWKPSELYVPPGLPWGHSEWTPKPLF